MFVYKFVYCHFGVSTGKFNFANQQKITITMTDIFFTENVKELLYNKRIWFLGDSNMRGLYKDVVWLMQMDGLVENRLFQGKLERSFMGDVKIFGGQQSWGRDFTEERRYVDKENATTLEFVFLTQVLSPGVQKRLQDIRQGQIEAPDVIFMNSGIWDVTRWGPRSVEKFKENIGILIRQLREVLPPHTLVIWATNRPVGPKIKGGVIIQQIAFYQEACRFELLEANYFCRQEFAAAGYDILDVHFHLIHYIHERRSDEVHWEPNIVRYVTCLMLTHISLSWKFPLPGNFKSPLLAELVADSESCPHDENQWREELKRVYQLFPEWDAAKTTNNNRNTERNWNRNWDRHRPNRPQNNGYFPYSRQKQNHNYRQYPY